ncbi:MAG: CPBP family intramembrane metalloprotease [Phycisphaeraceae bacterium]|nr:CPBP family intramembrane metalloprotease [Phycisphaeraceae bacterium]
MNDPNQEFRTGRVSTEEIEETGRRRPDPGTPTAALVAVLAFLMLIALIVYSNQTNAQAAASSAPPAPRGLDQVSIMSKIMVRLANIDRGGMNEANLKSFSEQVDAAAGGPWRAGPAREPVAGEGVTQAPVSDAVNRINAAIVAAELLGKEAAEERLSAMEAEGAFPEEARAMLPLVRRSLDRGQSLNEEERALLDERHGWFAELAQVVGLEDSDPAREAVVKRGAMGMVVWAVVFMLLLAGAFVGAIAAAIYMVVRYSRGGIRPAFAAPLPGGSVYMEMAAVFVLGFIVIKLVLPTLISSANPAWATRIMLSAQWVLLLAVLWPLARGVSWARTRRDLGWTSGRGLLREIGVGCVSYLAGLPLLVGAMIATMLIVLVRAMVAQSRGEAPTQPHNPVIDVVTRASTLELIFLFVLATCWAPLVEETIFRGALYRHLRAWLGLFAAAILTALLFGLMHGYSLFMLLPVITLGFCFALVREWRGSLVAPMTAHFIHNAVVLAMTLWGLSLVRA